MLSNAYGIVIPNSLRRYDPDQVRRVGNLPLSFKTKHPVERIEE
jgi:hypothetical protein